MFWLLNNYPPPYPKPKYIWARVRMRYETEKAILVIHKETKLWIPKSRIRRAKLRKGSFWIHVRETNLRS